MISKVPNLPKQPVQISDSVSQKDPSPQDFIRRTLENTYRESRTQSSPEEIQFSYGNLELY
jgi:hypothetical protein